MSRVEHIVQLGLCWLQLSRGQPHSSEVLCDFADTYLANAPKLG